MVERDRWARHENIALPEPAGPAVPPYRYVFGGWLTGAVRLIHAETGELKRMYVTPSGRRNGFSKRLVAALEARALGAKRLGLETGIRQLAALALYRGAGFQPIPLYGEYLVSLGTSGCLGKEL